MRRIVDICRDLHVGEDWEADLLREYVREVRKAALEEAARLSWPYDKEPSVGADPRHIERHKFALELRALAASDVGQPPAG